MPRGSSRSRGETGSNNSGRRRWRSRSRTRSRSRGRKQQTDAAQQHETSFGYQVAIEDGNYSYVTSPPPPSGKSGLTGNISSLFRTAFKRGSSGGEKQSSRDAVDIGYTPPLGLGDVRSPESSQTNKALSSSSPKRSSRFGFGGSSTTYRQENEYPSQNVTQQKHYYAAHASSGSYSGGKSVASATSSRLFYSNADDDSDDSEIVGASDEGPYTSGSTAYGTTDDGGSSTLASTSLSSYKKGASRKNNRDSTKTILRYRGFSTSIKNLFLDEALVCASMGCFGLILSNRTEFLLQLRNDRRGVHWGRSSSRKTLPSRILAYALLLTLLLIGFTFVIGGFGSTNSNSNSSFAFSYQNDDNHNYNAGDDYYSAGINYYNGGRHLGSLTPWERSPQTSHCANGIFKLRDMKESFWDPAMDYLSDEWYRPFEDQEEVDQYRRQDQQYSSNYKESSLSNHGAASVIRMSLICAFLIVLGILGRRRRMRTRYYIVRARAQEDHLFYASSGSGTRRIGFQDSREDQYEGACSHTLCGCYPSDPPKEGDEIEDEVQVGEEGVSQRKKKPHNEDCVGRGFNCLMNLCCGFVCRCWFQCLSICALAQEAREMRLLVPTRFQKVDFITHQPFLDYQKEITELRKTRRKTGISSHLKALSKLSRHILVLFVSTTVIIAATLFLNPRASFSWPDVIILSATFLQSFLVLWIVHWIFHKSDLSLDAVIKFFAAGFMIAVPSAFFFEGVLANATLTTAYIGYGLGEFLGGDVFLEWLSRYYGLIWIVAEMFNAYIVASVTEELCKYYTFRCVEHPDLIFLTGLVSSTQDERALEGGVVKYPFSSHQVQKTNAKNPYDDEASQYSRRSHRSKGSTKHLDAHDEFDEEEEEEQDIRTYRQKASAVTTAMISVAVGLACAENFLYVFLLGGTGAGKGESTMDGYLQEWIVLFFRSIFPVHALAAALQSVNMVRKFVETQDVNGHRIGVGRIILPAVIMHGTFDAILLGINVFIETSWDAYDGNIDDAVGTPYNPFVLNLVAWMSITFVMFAGLLWYYKENRSQRLRLIQLEEQERANQAGMPGYKGPREVELV